MYVFPREKCIRQKVFDVLSPNFVRAVQQSCPRSCSAEVRNFELSVFFIHGPFRWERFIYLSIRNKSFEPWLWRVVRWL
jgi:hypothetical protein